jgi:hypothetical protein
VDPVPDPLLLRKSGSSRNRTRDLWICSQELWQLDYRGGRKQLRDKNILLFIYVTQYEEHPTRMHNSKRKETNKLFFLCRNRSPWLVRESQNADRLYFAFIREK